MDNKSHLPWWAITILLAFIGGVIGLIYSQLANDGWFVPWHKVGTLPEKPLRFLPFERNPEEENADFLIELFSGKIYQYRSEEKVWYEWLNPEPFPDDIITEPCHKSSEFFFGLPGKVSQCTYLKELGGMDSFELTYYVVLNDRSVWTRLMKPSQAWVGICGWYELAGICVGWLAIVAYRRRPRLASMGVKTGYILVSVCLIAALLVLFGLVSPAAGGFLFRLFLIFPVYFFSPLMCLIIILAMLIGGVIIYWMKFRKVL